MNDSEPIQVMIVDDHAMVRTGLATFLEISDGMELVAEADNGKEAIALCEKYKPDVILMDLFMPEMDGVTATREIRKQYPDSQIIVITSFQEGDMVQDAIKAGAISYLLKNASMEELVNAIRAAHAGKATMAQEALQALVKQTSQPEEKQYGLTPREKEILELLVDGLNNPKISEKLHISIGTTRTHVSNIFSKLGVSNRAEAIAMALRNDLVE